MHARMRPLIGITLRPITLADRPFLETLYATTRAAELAMTDWDDAQKAVFVRTQFDLQHRYYQAHFADAAFEIIEHAKQPIGRRYIARHATAITLIDIALMPAWRGQGIGTAMLQELLGEAAATSKPVTLHVEHDNPAHRLYLRAGFEETTNNGVYTKMCWTHAGQHTSALDNGMITS